MRLSRDDWTALALRLLRDGGPAALTVARLCAAAGRTRGSLYHHFRDHDALVEAAVERWRAEHTEALRAGTPPGEGSSERLHAMAMGLDFPLEQAVRRLAARRPDVAASVAAVDRVRIEHLRALHVAEGRPDPAARAEVEYAAFLGFQQLELSPQRMAALYDWFAGLRPAG